MQVRVQPVRVAGVPDEADRLAGRDLRAVLQPRCVRRSRNALTTVVVVPREVVVQVDVVVGRAARPVEVEHAAGRRRGRPELDLACLRRERQRSLGGEDVDALVRPAGSWFAEVVAVVRGAENRENDRLCRVAACRGRSGQQAGGKQEAEGSSGFRPVALHELRFASEARNPNRHTGWHPERAVPG